MVPSKNFEYDLVKRAMDIVVSGAGLVITAPLQLAIWAVVRKVHGRPVLFRQLRPGKNAEVFEMIKFRTMLEPTEDRQTDEERLTKTGKILRATSLDELPTLWNVFKGDMSLVGPRPLLGSYLDHYSPEQARRHEVRPGITGLAQVNGRNSILWEDRFKLDVEYVNNRSLALDLKILKETFRAVLKREGISHSGHATMPKFSEGK
ncbi:sugar transferase [Corynebacterium callunae]|uniref:Glycosyltransferase n=1 Tax=Corynebacterium callunae DSM 20147 TaxID=1121353 RepID=M1UCX9_9CORY|nr:sugar transferase [Corynebacterium callunae]AGG65765.1 glycosyltransferase [Corynebacterium callunae DSM 20147]